VDFNDPFDCAFGIDFHNGATDKDWGDYFTHLAKERNLPPDKCRELAEDHVKRKRHRDLKFVEELEDETRKRGKEIGEGLGIFCLSSNPYSMTMWSHYADNHEGLLLRFDTRHLPRDRCFKAEYSVFLPRIPEYLKAVRTSNSDAPTEIIEELRKLFFCRKSQDWKKEKEWRLFSHSANSFLTFDPPMLSGVIFGCKMSNSIRNRIKEWTNEYTPTLELLEAKPCRNRFRMSITPIKDRKI
jgi:hypothetical protein